MLKKVCVIAALASFAQSLDAHGPAPLTVGNIVMFGSLRRRVEL